ncbi:MAG: 3'-5' exonuclease domain-containing protein 2 [Bacteroidales bacterium]|nr:3'-5' exonuclease domain-containing protein 2 [Bacteroidales bacterium]
MDKMSGKNMMNGRKYFENIEADYIKTLPVKSFKGTIYLVDTVEKLEAVKPLLLKEKTFGFDTETKPSFKKGQIHQVSLLQLATNDKAFLFRLNKIKMPSLLVRIIQDPDCLKIGAAIREDLNALKRLKSMEPKGFVELQELVKKYGIADNGLKKLAANVLGIRISKRNQTSNWARAMLTEEQLQYAATDAWVCLEIYKTLNHNGAYPS